MATIKIDPQTTREIIKDITTSTLSAYQLGHKYKLSKMTIDRIGREHLGTDIYSRREKLAFASLCALIKDFRDRNYSLTSIADQLGISKSSIFDSNSELLGTLIFLSGSDLRSMGTCFNYSRLKGTADLLREGVLIGK